MKAITVQLEPHYEPAADENPFQPMIKGLLRHQLETYQAMPAHDLVFNLYPTGTGKTMAALLGLLHFPQHNALIIAPTNALVGQHADDVRGFIREFGLPHQVIEVTAPALNNLDISGVSRRAKKLYELIRNPGVVNGSSTQRTPSVIVTNPDIFYYALFYLFNYIDRSNLGAQFLRHFNYIVIDELHYYNGKQLANFLYFIVISHKFGYFDHQDRKMVVLTATPDESLWLYIDRLQTQGIKCAVVKPEWSAKSLSQETANLFQSTAGVNLHLLPLGKRAEFAAQITHHIPYIEHALASQKDGLVISSSLRQINLVAAILRRTELNGKFARITGPVPAEARKAAAFHPLILATSTVDIGYNFQGHPKDRQNIDFGIFESNRLDAFWQRLGRIGRVLGKPVQDITSDVFAYIPEEAWNGLADSLDKSSYERPELEALMREVLLEKNLMKPIFHGEYIAYFSLQEVMLPLQNIYRRLPAELRDIIEETFVLLKSIYCPTSRKTFKQLNWGVRDFQAARDMLNSLRNNPTRIEKKKLAPILQEQYGTYAEDVFELIVNKDEEMLEDLEFRMQNRICAYSGMFNFRSQSAGRQIVAYDRNSLLSESGGWVSVDPLHLARNFGFRTLTGKKEAQKLTGLEPPNGDIYVSIDELHSKPLDISLEYIMPDFLDWTDLENSTGWFIALKGIKISAVREGALVPLPRPVRNLLHETYITGLLLPRVFEPAIIYRCYRDDIIPFRLTAKKDGRNQEYHFFPGVAAYNFWARYGWTLRKADTSSIIV